MIQSIFWKWVFKKIWGLIKDANDDRMAKSHHKRIKSLEKQVKQIQKNQSKILHNQENIEKDLAILGRDSHPPIFGKSELRKIERRLKRLEKNV